MSVCRQSPSLNIRPIDTLLIWITHLQCKLTGKHSKHRIGLQLGRTEVLRGLRNFLNMDRPEQFRTDCLQERGVGKGSGRHSTFRGREHWYCFEGKFGETAERWGGAHMRLSERYGAILSINCRSVGLWLARQLSWPVTNARVFVGILTSPLQASVISGTDLLRQFYVLPH